MKHPANISIGEIFHGKSERLGLVLDAGANGLSRTLPCVPALTSQLHVVDYLSTEHPVPVQIIAPERHADLVHANDRLAETIRGMLERGDIAMLVASDGLELPAWLRDTGNQTGVCIYRSTLSHSMLFERLQHRAARKLIEPTTLHGVLLSIRNVGVLVSGPSGIGKSEVALDLVNSGHRLVADDAVLLYRSSPYKVTGFCPELLRGYLEVRGLGILDIADIYGNTAVLESQAVDLIVRLERETRPQPDDDRLMPRIRQFTILDTSIPEITLTVAPGRNLAVLIEAAVRTHIQFQFGKDPIKAFINKQELLMARRRRLLQQNDR